MDNQPLSAQRDVCSYPLLERHYRLLWFFIGEFMFYWALMYCYHLWVEPLVAGGPAVSERGQREQTRGILSDRQAKQTSRLVLQRLTCNQSERFFYFCIILILMPTMIRPSRLPLDWPAIPICRRGRICRSKTDWGNSSQRVSLVAKYSIIRVATLESRDQ